LIAVECTVFALATGLACLGPRLADRPGRLAAQRTNDRDRHAADEASDPRRYRPFMPGVKPTEARFG